MKLGSYGILWTHCILPQVNSEIYVNNVIDIRLKFKIQWNNLKYNWPLCGYKSTVLIFYNSSSLPLSILYSYSHYAFFRLSVSTTTVSCHCQFLSCECERLNLTLPYPMAYFLVFSHLFPLHLLFRF